MAKQTEKAYVPMLTTFRTGKVFDNYSEIQMHLATLEALGIKVELTKEGALFVHYSMVTTNPLQDYAIDAFFEKFPSLYSTITQYDA